MNAAVSKPCSTNACNSAQVIVVLPQPLPVPPMTSRGARALTAVELLPYNRMAGAKYDWLGAAYAPMFDPEQPVQFRHDLFQNYGIESRGR